MAITNLQLLKAIGIDEKAAIQLTNIAFLKGSWNPNYLNRVIKSHIREYEKKNGTVPGDIVMGGEIPELLNIDKVKKLFENDIKK